MPAIGAFCLVEVHPALIGIWLELSFDSLDPLMLIPNDFSESLIFPVAPPSGQHFHISALISPGQNELPQG